MSFLGKIKGLSPTIKDWLNVIASVGGLMVAIVSLWVTAQISGIQDYFQSEIMRRNQELNDVSQYKNRIDRIAESRLQKIEKLQQISDQLNLYVNQAQIQLFDISKNLDLAERNLQRSKEVIYEKDQISQQLNAEILDKNEKIETLDRKTLYVLISFRGLIPILDGTNSRETVNGVDIYSSLVNIAVADVPAELVKYLSEFKVNATLACEPLRQYSTKIPTRKQYPKMPPVKGQTVLEGGKLMYRFTQSEFESYEKNEKQYKLDIDNTSRFNDSIFKYSAKVDKYLLDMTHNCTCRALATENISAAKICETEGGDLNPPKYPDEFYEK